MCIFLDVGKENFRKRNGMVIRQPEATSLARQVAFNRPECQSSTQSWLMSIPGTIL